MRSVSRRSGIEVLDADECRCLLAQDEIGRLAVVVGATPMIFPVNYALDGDDIVCRTVRGSHIHVDRGHAAFEIDRFDRNNHSGWSVLVTGRLEEITPYHDADLERVRHLGVTPWAPGQRDLWMRLRVSFITGRIVRATEPRVE